MSNQPLNFKLIAIFAVPLLFVTALLQASKRFVDVLDGDSNLEALVKQAKAAGYPFEASELAVKGVPDSNNGSIPLKQLFMNKQNPLPKDTREVTDYWLLDKKELDPNVAELIRRAKVVAAKTQFDAKRDYDLGPSLDFPEYPKFKLISNALTYDACHKARHGDDEGAIESLRLAKAVANQLSSDSYLNGMLVNLSCQAIFYRAVGNVAHEMRGRPVAQRKLFSLLASGIPVAEFEDAMKVEFYLALSVFRNANVAQLTFDSYPSDCYPFGSSTEVTTFVRSGLPKSVLGQSMLAKYIEITLAQRQVRKRQTNLAQLVSDDEGYYRGEFTSLSGRTLEFITPLYANARTALLKPEVYRAFARWAIEIAIAHPNGYPETLPSRPDPAFGGTLQYRKFGPYYTLYSSGVDKVDNGGQLITIDKNNPDKGDDFGILVPYVPKEPIKPSDSGAVPSQSHSGPRD